MSPKFQKNDFQKIFKTQNPMMKCLFLTPFFQLTILNFRIESLKNLWKVPIPKFKMYFLGVWRKKIFYEFWGVFEKVHIEFFILGLVEKWVKINLEVFQSFDWNFWLESIQDLEQNWEQGSIQLSLLKYLELKSLDQILETIENWNPFKEPFQRTGSKNLIRTLITIWIRIDSRSWSELRTELFKILNLFLFSLLKEPSQIFGTGLFQNFEPQSEQELIQKVSKNKLRVLIRIDSSHLSRSFDNN